MGGLAFQNLTVSLGCSGRAQLLGKGLTMSRPRFPTLGREGGFSVSWMARLGLAQSKAGWKRAALGPVLGVQPLVSWQGDGEPLETLEEGAEISGLLA